MDAVLQAALAPVLRDLRTAAIGPPRVEDRDWTDDPDAPSVMLHRADGSGAGVSVLRSLPEADRVAAVADQVQEWAVETLWGTAPTNWPPCPHHPVTHPLRAAVRDGAAVWECPADSSPVAAVGALGAVPT